MKRHRMLALAATIALTHLGCGDSDRGDKNPTRTPNMIGDTNRDIFQWTDFWVSQPQLKARYRFYR